MNHEFCAEVVQYGKETSRKLPAGQIVCSVPVTIRDGERNADLAILGDGLVLHRRVGGSHLTFAETVPTVVERTCQHKGKLAAIMAVTRHTATRLQAN